MASVIRRRRCRSSRWHRKDRHRDHPGNGWYSEIPAPLLHDKGHYVAAVVDPMAVPEGRGRDYQQRSRDSPEKKYAGAPAQFGKTAVVAYDPAKPVFGPANSADVVLTFRNVHNWRKAGQAQGMFRASSTCSSRAACWAWSSIVPRPT